MDNEQGSGLGLEWNIKSKYEGYVLDSADDLLIEEN